MSKSMLGMWLLVILMANSALGARILGLFPIPVKSHMILNSAYMKGLADRGHEVVVFSPLPEPKPYPNYTDVLLDVMFPELLEGTGSQDWFEKRDGGHFQFIAMLWGVGNKLCHRVYQHEYIQKLIHSNEEKFDLIVIGAFFYDCVIGLAHKFNTPVVEFSSFFGTTWMYDWVGNPNPYSYVPDMFLPYTDKMTFSERIMNTLSILYHKFGREFYFMPKQNEIIQKYFNETKNFPSIYELEKRISLLLVNSHFSISYPRPLAPNVIQVGGLQVKEPKKLPMHLQKYLDEAPNGVIYFSMGSNLRSSNLPEVKRKAILEAFSKLKYNVLWKWETDVLPGQPKNVKVEKWLPQSDILAHPNIKLFISHGGLLSTQETIIRGVPVVGIPIYGDQSLNMARTESAGIGLKLEFANVTTDSLLWAIHEVIGNPKYTENAKRSSRLFRDQPLTPMEQAMYWTEYVIRHKGAPHMRSAALDLAWYQYFLLDVIGVLILAVGIVVLVLFVIMRTLFKICCGGSKSETNISSKKKRN